MGTVTEVVGRVGDRDVLAGCARRREHQRSRGRILGFGHGGQRDGRVADRLSEEHIATKTGAGHVDEIVRVARESDDMNGVAGVERQTYAREHILSVCLRAALPEMAIWPKEPGAVPLTWTLTWQEGEKVPAVPLMLMTLPLSACKMPPMVKVVPVSSRCRRWPPDGALVVQLVPPLTVNEPAVVPRRVGSADRALVVQAVVAGGYWPAVPCRVTPGPMVNLSVTVLLLKVTSLLPAIAEIDRAGGPGGWFRVSAARPRRNTGSRRCCRRPCPG